MSFEGFGYAQHANYGIYFFTELDGYRNTLELIEPQSSHSIGRKQLLSLISMTEGKIFSTEEESTP